MKNKVRNNCFMRRTILFITIFLFSYLTVIAQRISAYQTGSYQPGIMNIRDLAASSGEGFVFIDYNYWNSSTSFHDQFGNKVKSLGIDLSPLNPANGQITLNLEPQISGYANIFVLFYASNLKLFNGRYLASINPVYQTSNYNMNMYISDTSVVSSGNTGGFGDLSIMPFGLSWSFNDKIDLSFLYVVYLPTGKYEIGASDNIGKGYWTHQLQAPFYYYLNEKATALFVMPTFEINGTVKNSDVRPGSRFTIEYGISHYITPWLEIEILNGHNWQISNDAGKDVWWRNSQLYVKDKTSTVSIGLGAWPWEGRLNVRAKYAMDYGTRQRYKSNFLSVSFIYIPNF
jgi:hypothetical protein